MKSNYSVWQEDTRDIEHEYLSYFLDITQFVVLTS